MKKSNYLVLLLLFTFNFSIAQIGIGTTAPDAQLDIRSSNQATPANNDGILIPKVDAFPATNPTVAQQGMLVYLTTPTIFGGNPKPIGFYYWDNGTPDWVGISSAANGDHDWYEEGTTTAPNSITDDMFHTGNVAIGKSTADYPLEVQNNTLDTSVNLISDYNVSNATEKSGIKNTITGTTLDGVLGINNSINTPNTNFASAIRNNLTTNGNFTSGLYNQISSGAGDTYAINNEINTNSLNGFTFGIRNNLDHSGNAGRVVGAENLISTSGSALQYGVNNTLNNTGTGTRYGVSNTLTGGASTSNQFGVRNQLNINGNATKYGVYNNISNSSGNGDLIGETNNISGTAVNSQIGIENIITGTATISDYGVKNTFIGNGNEIKYGIHNDFTSTGTSINYGVFSSITGNSNGNQYGINNSITNTGNGFHYGINNDMTANGAGQKIGVKNNITNNNATITYGVENTIISNGIPYGIYNNISNSNSFGGSATYGHYNYLQGTSNGQYFGLSNLIDANGTGAKHGFFSRITTTSGGTHYGVYSEVLKPGATNFAGYFLGNVGIGTTAANTYTFPPSRGTINQIMVTNGTGVVSWQNASAIQDHDWYEVGTLLGPDAITDVMFHTGNVSIGKNTNTYPLDVTSATRTINSVSTVGTTAAVFGFNTAALGASGGGYGVAGQTSQSSSQAVRGEQLNTSGYAIGGINFGASGAGTGGGTYCQTTQSAGFGLDARNLNASGTAIISTGQNAGGTYLIAGSGGSFNGVTTGLHARNTSLGISEAIYSDNGGVVCRVNYWNGTTQFKIIGTGTVSTTAENTNGERVTLYCPEAPEILFEDYGQGQLVNGSVHIEIDPTIAKNIVVNDKHPLRVYIQLEDNCNGVYVTNKTGNSFDVIELASGQSNAKFQYHIIGNRADEVLPNGRISKNADMRFEPAPKDRETREATAVDVGKPATVK